MRKNLNIIPECYVDTNLVSYLLDGIGVNHQKGCNNVARIMQKNLKNDFAVGIMDDDKLKNDYIKQFTCLAASTHLELFCHSERPHYIIIVKKAVEDFILSVAQECDFDLTSVQLAKDLEGLKRFTKTCQSNYADNLRQFFAQVAEASEMKILKSLLKYLCENRFKADQDEILQIFSPSCRE